MKLLVSRKNTKMNLPGPAAASKFGGVVVVDVLLLTQPHENLATFVVIGVNFDAAVAVEVQELVAQKLLGAAVEKSYSCVLDYFAAYESVGLGGYKLEFEPVDDKYVVPLY